jgi:ABC-type Fe3+-hydroxamate transport system substrate-binding protein
MQVLKITAEKFLSQNPYLLETVMGVKFYEHPTRGGEAPILAVKNGKVYVTDAWDCGDLENDSGMF